MLLNHNQQMLQSQPPARARLLQRTEMLERFAKIASPETSSNNHVFYAKLMEYAGYSVGIHELAFLVLEALESRAAEPMSSEDLREHMKAMLGDGPDAVALLGEFESLMDDVAAILAKMN